MRALAALAVFGTCLARLGESMGVYGNQKSCSVPRVDSGGQALTCPDAPPSTLDEAVANGWRFAPLVRFHPLETHFMESPDDWFETSTLYPAPGEGLTKEFRSQYGPDVSLLEAEELAVNNVTAFDGEGRSTAKVYFTVQEYADDYWLYNYELFFGWNGCSSQEYAVPNMPSSYLSYYMCPAGVHEADLEIVSVVVCKSDLVGGAKRVGYNQHAWSEIRNCDDAVGCPTEDGHPVAYASLGGHALYPESDAPFNVYFHDPKYPIWVGDRTADGGKTFVPTQENVKFLPSLDGLPEGTSWEWARFGGNWGRIFAEELDPPTSIRCFSEDGLMFVECGADKRGVVEIIKLGASLTSEGGPAREQFMNGPLQRSATYQIIGNKLPPVLESGGGDALLCPRDVAFGAADGTTMGGSGSAIDTSPQVVVETENGASEETGSGKDMVTDNVITPVVTAAPPPPQLPNGACLPAAIRLLLLVVTVILRDL